MHGLESVPSLSSSFDIDISSQSQAAHDCDARITQLRQRLMQSGKVMSKLEELGKEMQHQRQIRAQHALSQQIIALHSNAQKEQRTLQQLQQNAHEFIHRQCKQDFIPSTKHAHQVLSHQYVAAQHDTIRRYEIEIEDIKRGIDSNPSQILRAFHILFSIHAILSKIRTRGDSGDDDSPDLDLMEDSDTAQLELHTPQHKLRLTQISLASYCQQVLPAIKDKYLHELELALKAVSWPNIGDQKRMDMSSPHKWGDIEMLCCDVFSIELHLHRMIKLQLFPAITHTVMGMEMDDHARHRHRSWVLHKFCEPIIKRFAVYFDDDDSPRNRLNKPEWFLRFALDVISDNLAIAKQVLQPLVLETGLQLDIDRAFVHSMMESVSQKCAHSIDMMLQALQETASPSQCGQHEQSKKMQIYETSANVTKTAMQGMKVMKELSTHSLHSLYESSFSLLTRTGSTGAAAAATTVDVERKLSDDEQETQAAAAAAAAEKIRAHKQKRALNERKLRHIRALIHHWIAEMVRFQIDLSAAYPWTIGDPHTNIVSLIVRDASMRKEWLQMEKHAINQNCTLINCRPSMDNTQLFALYHREHIDRSSQFWMTNAVYEILSILQSVKHRTQSIVDMQHRLQFVQELVVQVLRLSCQFIEEQFVNHIHYRVKMSYSDIVTCCGMINSSDFLVQFLDKWNRDLFFQSLAYYRQLCAQKNEEDDNTDGDGVSMEWVMRQARTLNLDDDDGDEQEQFFTSIMDRLAVLHDRHMHGLADVICHELLMETSAQYIDATFGYVRYVQNENESMDSKADDDVDDDKEEDMDMVATTAFGVIQNEFQDAYHNLSEAMYACYSSLPGRLFSILRDDMAREIDEKLFEQLLNMKYTFYHRASQKLRFDLEHLFSLFYVQELDLMPSYQRIDVMKLKVNHENKFPKLSSLLIILSMRQSKLRHFMTLLGLELGDIRKALRPAPQNGYAGLASEPYDAFSAIDQKLSSETTQQILQQFRVDSLNIKQVAKILSKVSAIKKMKPKQTKKGVEKRQPRTDNKNKPDNDSDSSSSSTEISSDFGTTQF